MTIDLLINSIFNNTPTFDRVPVRAKKVGWHVEEDSNKNGFKEITITHKCPLRSHRKTRLACSYIQGFIYPADMSPPSPDQLLEFLGDSKTACLADLLVHESHRREGYATQLVNRWLDWAKKNKVEKVFLSAFGERWLPKFYKRFGFRVLWSSPQESVMGLVVAEAKKP